MDAPAIMQGVLTGFMARPSAKTSIGKVFQDRAARYGDKLFVKFGDETVTYREANETANRYAAVLAARGVGRGDVVGIMLKNSPRAVVLMLAVVKLGAIAGMLNYNQRGKVLAHSVGLLNSVVLIGEDELLDAVHESDADLTDELSVDELERLAADAPTENPNVTSSVLAKDKAFYIFTSGTTGMPKASVMTHYRWLRALGWLRRHRDAAEQQRRLVLLPAAVPQQRAHRRGVIGAERGRNAGTGQVVLGVEVLGRGHPLRGDRVRVHR